MSLILYDFPTSSAAFRTRIALGLKGLDFERRRIDLRAGGQRSVDFLTLNPQGLVPALVEDGQVLTQSLAIIEYLDETRPEPPFLPADPAGRARVRALALSIACDLHPLNNLRVLQYITGPLGHDEATKLAWYRHWIAEGMGALEALLQHDPVEGRFCHGDAPGLADICLVPQVFNAKRYDCPLGDYPTVMHVFQACMTVPAFVAAQPEPPPAA